MVEQRLADLNLRDLAASRASFFPSPPAWEDQVLYFLLLDRFSDGNENRYYDNDGNLVTTGRTPLYQPTDGNNAIRTEKDAARWRDAGGKFCGGTLKGVTSKIGYLKRMGITAIWVSPIFRQIQREESYHGYGIQNFLDVDPRFGTREDLRQLVDAAHGQGIYVILDIILNHSGNVFAYDSPDPYWRGAPYPVKGFFDREGKPALPFGPVDLSVYPNAWPDGAIWPAELQRPGTFSCKGYIRNWDNFPEYLEGDFFILKDIYHGGGDSDHYQPSDTLKYLSEAYKFWMAYADVDGFRIDTVKHMDPGATRFFATDVREFAQSIGKENFHLIGEITGGRERAFHTLEDTGLDAALAIDEIPDKMEFLIKGYRDPSAYFDLFSNSLLTDEEAHIWFRDRVVTMIDDHDKVNQQDYKARFCADQDADKVLFNALALNATTLGIPCIYYGTEQGFDGQGDNDRYIREAMFGGPFGAFRSKNRHFFNEETPIYQQLAQILAIRKKSKTLCRGRQYLRPISGDGENFGLPTMVGSEIRSIVPWSRLFNDEEILLAINTDYHQAHTMWVTIDDKLNRAGDVLCCTYSTDMSQTPPTVTVEARNGKSVRLTVPAAGFAMYEQMKR